MASKNLLILVLALVAITSKISAQTKYWDGGATTSNWSDALNWSDDLVPVAGDSVVLNHQFLTGDYSVDLPNSLVVVNSLSIYPSSPGDSIFVNIPQTNTVAPNLRVTGIGFSALRIGERGRFNNRANTFGDVFVMDDLFNFGLLLDEGGYFYQASQSKDTTLLRKLTALTNSTFEYDRPTGGYQDFVFPVGSQVGNVTFYNLILSGNNAGSMSYGGTLANNWDLIINGDLTIRDGASFGVVRGAVNQIRYVRFRGDINIINTSNTLWFESTASSSFGWYAVFDGTQSQTISADITFLDSVVIDNPNGVVAEGRFEVKTGFASVSPKLHLRNGILTTGTNGIVIISLDDPGTIVGHPTDSSQTAPSYVNGNLKRAIAPNGIYEFPVGTPSHYELATITTSNLIGTDSLTVQFFESGIGTIPTPLADGSDLYHFPVNAGYWNVMPNAQPSSGNYNVTLFETGFTNGMAPYTVVKRTDDMSPWMLEGSADSFDQIPGVIVSTRNGFSAFSDFAVASSFQTDYEVSYANYDNGDLSTLDTIKTKFSIKNLGPLVLEVSDVIYVSSRLNGVYFGLDLLGDKTPITLTQQIPVGDSLIVDPGYILGSETLPFFFPATDLEVCIVVWGKGLEAVDFTPAFPADMNPSNNVVCMTYTTPSTAVLNENSKSIVYSVFPNPATNQIYFSGSDSQDFFVRLIDASGREVLVSETGNGNLNLNLENLEQGIYIYQIFSGETIVQTGKMIKN